MGWERENLGELANVNYGFTAKANHEKGDLKFLRVTDIQDDSVNWDTVPFCKTPEKNPDKYILKRNDIVFARTGATTGKSYLIVDPPQAVFASYLIKASIASDKILPSFLYKFFQTAEYWNVIEAGTSGSAQGGFNASKLKDLAIPLPPLPEQRRLVNLLDAAFGEIERARELLERNLVNAGELFESRLVKILSSKKEGWSVKTLKEVCSVITDGTHQTPTYFDDGYIFLSSRNVKTGKIDWENIKYIDEVQHQKMYGRLAPQIGDVLLAKNGTTGVAAIVDVDRVFDIYVSLALLRPTSEIYPEFLLRFVNSPVAKKQFNSRLKGSGVPNLHLKEIREVRMAFPKSLNKQEEVANKISTLKDEVDKVKDKYQGQLHHLTELKQSLLAKAFAGEL
jgi:type I restriction enzyme S subunit